MVCYAGYILPGSGQHFLISQALDAANEGHPVSKDMLLACFDWFALLDSVAVWCTQAYAGEGMW